MKLEEVSRCTYGITAWSSPHVFCSMRRSSISLCDARESSKSAILLVAQCLLCILSIELTDPDIFGEDEAQNPFLDRELRLGHLSWTDIVTEPLRKSHTEHLT